MSNIINNLMGQGSVKYDFLDMEVIKNKEIDKLDESLKIVISRYDTMAESGYIPTCVMKNDNGKINYLVFDIRKPLEHMPDYIKSECQKAVNFVIGALDSMEKE